MGIRNKIIGNESMTLKMSNTRKILMKYDIYGDNCNGQRSFIETSKS